MKILFDQGTPAPLKKHLVGHNFQTAFERGWSTLENGELLSKAEKDGYQVFVTTDTNLSYQQNLKNRNITIIALLSTSWPKIEKQAVEIHDTISNSKPNEYIEVKIQD